MKLTTPFSIIVLAASAQAHIVCADKAVGGVAPARQSEHWIPSSMVAGSIFRLPSSGCQRFGNVPGNDKPDFDGRKSEVWACINDEALARGKTDVNITPEEMLACVEPLCIGKDGCRYTRKDGDGRNMALEVYCGGQNWPEGKDFNCIYRQPGPWDDVYEEAWE